MRHLNVKATPAFRFHHSWFAPFWVTAMAVAGAVAQESRPAPTSRTSPALAALETFVRTGSLAEVAAQPWASTPLSRADAALARDTLWAAHATQIRRDRAAEFEARALTAAGQTMRFWFTTCGAKPSAGRSLWISLHGGGSVDARTNDQQWVNQKRLYRPTEGIYLAPRAPTNAWNLWHEAHIDALLDRLIEDLVVLEDVNPDRVYILGYSAGGDGVYQLAPRMADRWAAAAMMAGHPNDARPDGLRNLPFALHVGADDAEFHRNDVAREWGTMLDGLAAADPGGYPHSVQLHAGKAHWMDREDAAALPWMAQRTRELRPAKVVWLQSTRTHERFYWLRAASPTAGARIVADRDGSVVRIREIRGLSGALRIRLDDSMTNLDDEVTVRIEDREAFHGRAPRTIATLAQTLLERGDPRGMFAAEISVTP